MIRRLLSVLLLCSLTGCTTLDLKASAEDALAKLDEAMAQYGLSQSNKVEETSAAYAGNPSDFPAEIDGAVKWLHFNVGNWPVTAAMSAAITGSSIQFPYSKAKVWSAVDGVNANPWVIAKVNGQWYAGTFEWLRYGQTSKPKGVLDRSGGLGDHIKVSPLSSWTPKSGERIGIMVSGLARTSARNSKERTSVVMVTWP